MICQYYLLQHEKIKILIRIFLKHVTAKNKYELLLQEYETMKTSKKSSKWGNIKNITKPVFDYKNQKNQHQI